ncbi:MAG: PQQ-binding-like beta-propeller repeat protein [Ktedonobacterales bacterium]|nr:PQQ-binding-like beta-propeller repeat protein [Ktedonobacterales bacterium]
MDIGNGVLLGSDAIARRISAFDAASGRVLWERAGVFVSYKAFGNDAFVLNTPAPASLTAPQVASTLSALDLRTGAVHWQRDFNDTTQPSPTQLLFNGGLVIGVSSFQTTSLYAYRPSDGKQLWHFTANEAFIRLLPDPS